MIKIISTDCGTAAKELWTKLKKMVDNSMIMEIELEREVADITDDLGIVREKEYTGVFEIKLRCMTK